MTGWESPEEATDERRAYLRRRLIRGLRGWLYAHSRPRLHAALMLAVSLAVGNVLAASLPLAGVLRPAFWAFVAVLGAWPVFMMLIALWGQLEFSQMHADEDVAQLLATDSAEEQRTYDEHDGLPEERSIFWLSEGTGCLLIFAHFTVVILGKLFLDLITQGPTLVAETYLDRALFPRHPSLSRTVQAEPWLQNLALATVPYFAAFAVAAGVIAITVAFAVSHFWR